MSAFATLFHDILAVYRLIVTSWNACIVLLQVVRFIVEVARQEVAELAELLDDSVPTVDAMISTASQQDTGDPADSWQMLIIVRASSFVLLLRLSKRRVLHLEVDERFIISKLEVIRTELVLHVEHVPRLLQMPIGTHDMRLVRYTPLRRPHLWKEELANPQCTGEVAERAIVPAGPPASPITAGEGRARRKRYVQLLAEGALRRRLHKDGLKRTGTYATPKKGTGTMKVFGRNEVMKKALANATNMDTAHAEESGDVEGVPEETHASQADVVETPKQARVERMIHTALSENLSIPSMVLRSASSRKAAKGTVQQQRGQMGSESLRRKRGSFDLYAQGVSSEFSLVSKMGQGRE